MILYSILQPASLNERYLARALDQVPRVVAIEVKRAERWDRSWEKPLRSLSELSGVKVERMIGIYCGSRSYYVDGLQVWPVGEFVKALHAGEVF